MTIPKVHIEPPKPWRPAARPPAPPDACLTTLLEDAISKLKAIEPPDGFGCWFECSAAWFDVLTREALLPNKDWWFGMRVIVDYRLPAPVAILYNRDNKVVFAWWETPHA